LHDAAPRCDAVRTLKIALGALRWPLVGLLDRPEYARSGPRSGFSAKGVEKIDLDTFWRSARLHEIEPPLASLTR
jgi:hypothetical protein